METKTKSAPVITYVNIGEEEDADTVELPEVPVKKARNPRIKLPEAGGVAWADLTIVVTENGKTYRGKINLTARGFDTVEALDNLMTGIKHAKTVYHARLLH
jgi:hypothetical protein